MTSRESLLAGGEQGPAVIPGNLTESLILAAIEHRDGMRMPPKGKKLDDRIIEDFRRWVKDGAVYPVTTSERMDSKSLRSGQHWAFQPLNFDRPATFGIDDPALIDRWVDNSIKEKGLEPTKLADRRTLLRRASIALQGLPPRPEEVDQFLNDMRPDEIAFESQLSRLLSSPRFGERWARHWLDLARYSDTKGYVFFEENDFPWSHTYRDYVIQAFSTDKPYDQFLKEQIAADRMTPAISQESLAALGFLTLGNRFMNNPHDIIDDRIDVVTRPLLGLSVACARCHDHKFDPISAKDYYGLYGVFANSVEPLLPPGLGPKSVDEKAQSAEKEILHRHDQLKAFVDAKYEALAEVARRRAGDYLFAADAARKAPKTDDFMLIADGGDLNPTMILRWRAFIESSRKKQLPIMALWHQLADIADSDFAESLSGALPEVNNPILKAKIIELRPDRAEVLAQAYGAAFKEAFLIWREYRDRQVSAGLPSPDRHPENYVEELRLILDGPDAPTRLARNPQGDLNLLPDRASQAELRKLIGEFEKSRRTAGAAIRPQMLVDRQEIDEVRVFVRGNPQNEGEPAPRKFLSVFERAMPESPFPANSSGRLQLADAIADQANPLTARVYVNRVWGILFGRGLVSTPGDFGLRGEPPSHPELLDALAVDFIRSGWSTKRLIRRIMSSQAYRRSALSEDDSRSKSLDPENRYISYFPVRRLDYETMRDSLLHVSGLLETSDGGAASGSSTDTAFSKRGIYGKIDRLNLPEQMRSFDFPDPNASAVERSITTTPGQSLYLMNHALMRRCAEGLTDRVHQEGEEALGAAGRMARIVWQRNLSERERGEIREFLERTAALGDRDRWLALAQAFLMSNEFHFTE